MFTTFVKYNCNIAVCLFTSVKPSTCRFV